MFRFILRSAGFILLAVAFSGLVVDGTRSIAAHRILQFSFGDLASWLAPARTAALLEGTAHWPDAAQRLLRGLMAVPGWVVTGAMGTLLFYAGRPRAPSIGRSRR